MGGPAGRRGELRLPPYRSSAAVRALCAVHRTWQGPRVQPPGAPLPGWRSHAPSSAAYASCSTTRGSLGNGVRVVAPSWEVEWGGREGEWRDGGGGGERENIHNWGNFTIYGGVNNNLIVT